MTHASSPNPNAPQNPPKKPDAGSDADFYDLLAFAPMPMQRRRADRWSAERQRRFITALSVMGAVGPAARAAGFVEAWNIAIAYGADPQFHTALDQAINGVTTVRVMRGSTVEVVNPRSACLRRFRRRRRRLKRQGRHYKCAPPALFRSYSNDGDCA